MVTINDNDNDDNIIKYSFFCCSIQLSESGRGRPDKDRRSQTFQTFTPAPSLPSPPSFISCTKRNTSTLFPLFCKKKHFSFCLSHPILHVLVVCLERNTFLQGGRRRWAPQKVLLQWYCIIPL